VNNEKADNLYSTNMKTYKLHKMSLSWQKIYSKLLPRVSRNVRCFSSRTYSTFEHLRNFWHTVSWYS